VNRRAPKQAPVLHFPFNYNRQQQQQQQQLKVSRGDAAYFANITITNGMDGVRYCA
jgi:hypothetical protein